ncbi:Hypothetical predicted protein [Podarcis lilfordi]|uniref:Uncharacterized protein n=1 Tax=Podarcis lilfordi TaxID=74358 RepID=A0AA35KQ94_9SAUR|nr:Hypothetical predicted protein [Podarcis lilfordi]
MPQVSSLRGLTKWHTVGVGTYHRAWPAARPIHGSLLGATLWPGAPRCPKWQHGACIRHCGALICKLPRHPRVAHPWAARPTPTAPGAEAASYALALYLVTYDLLVGLEIHRIIVPRVVPGYLGSNPTCPF